MVMESCAFLRHESGNGKDGDSEKAREAAKKNMRATIGEVSIAEQPGEEKLGQSVCDGANYNTVLRGSAVLDSADTYRDRLPAASNHNTEVIIIPLALILLFRPLSLEFPTRNITFIITPVQKHLLRLPYESLK